ncbi:uncharacterized protein CLUP02_16143 [Colletotrichum lupini]|uniref:Uncharacterized protein n=1 Tax=Colletotrichum lupini TaxID=145971 RepID=A0A9Q8T7F9_9PEZI|nr:uncharacterized protein CLUP02_16143 [Colletotrichum lupini]UQC90613.1 hypothetical protein CLUP02_16143 [Colletotrichum lupini]
MIFGMSPGATVGKSLLNFPCVSTSNNDDEEYMEHRCCSWYRAKPAVEEAKKSMVDRQEVTTPDGRDGYVGDGWYKSVKRSKGSNRRKDETITTLKEDGKTSLQKATSQTLLQEKPMGILVGKKGALPPGFQGTLGMCGYRTFSMSLGTLIWKLSKEAFAVVTNDWRGKGGKAAWSDGLAIHDPRFIPASTSRAGPAEEESHRNRTTLVGACHCGCRTALGVAGDCVILALMCSRRKLEWRPSSEWGFYGLAKHSVRISASDLETRGVTVAPGLADVCLHPSRRLDSMLVTQPITFLGAPPSLLGAPVLSLAVLQPHGPLSIPIEEVSAVDVFSVSGGLMTALETETGVGLMQAEGGILHHPASGRAVSIISSEESQRQRRTQLIWQCITRVMVIHIPKPWRFKVFALAAFVFPQENVLTDLAPLPRPCSSVSLRVPPPVRFTHLQVVAAPRTASSAISMLPCHFKLTACVLRGLELCAGRRAMGRTRAMLQKHTHNNERPWAMKTIAQSMLPKFPTGRRGETRGVEFPYPCSPRILAHVILDVSEKFPILVPPLRDMGGFAETHKEEAAVAPRSPPTSFTNFETNVDLEKLKRGREQNGFHVILEKGQKPLCSRLASLRGELIRTRRVAPPGDFPCSLPSSSSAARSVMRRAVVRPLPAALNLKNGRPSSPPWWLIAIRESHLPGRWG